jgi:DHA1 family tetracycline resistance protein-like MFS transporter
MIIGPFLMTQVFSAFAKPGTPFAIGDVVVLPSGAPFYFPGAPFAVASALVLCGLLTLRAAFARERPRATGDISAQAPRRD